jgi:exopolyphosphatase/guanosine-5'-triphosphate,3'-diphosphate pyrophosphatase
MVIQAIMNRLDIKNLTISVNGLREGIFFAQFFWQDQSTPIIDDVRQFSILNLARVYAFHQQHAFHVRHLASRLFEQLAPLHGYGVAELELLEAASLLHDLGTTINYEDHHKHSQMLIVNNGLPGYTPRETALISLLARYHRKGNPAVDDFASIVDDGDDERLTRLAALLRLAEFLERGRDGAVQDATVSWDNGTLLVSLVADTYPAVELWDAERNAAPLVERAFDRKVRIECPGAPVRWN